MTTSPYSRIRTACVGAALLGSLLLAGSAAAQVNGSFETTQSNDGFHFASWTVYGGAATLTNQFGDTPPAGVRQAFISSDATGITNAYGVAGQNIAGSVSAATLATDLGVTTTALNTAAGVGNTVQDGSAIAQTITVGANAFITFRYNFITSEDPLAPTYGAVYNQDAAFLTLGSTVTRLANTTNALTAEPALANRPSPSIDDYLSETGYQTYTSGILTPGVYNLGFSVGDILSSPNTTGGTSQGSALLIDNIVVTPEPSPVVVFALGTLGLAGAGWAARRRRVREEAA